MGNRDTKVCDWIDCFPPGGKILNLGNLDNCKGKCSGQTNIQTNSYFINIDIDAFRVNDLPGCSTACCRLRFCFEHWMSQVLRPRGRLTESILPFHKDVKGIKNIVARRYMTKEANIQIHLIEFWWPNLCLHDIHKYKVLTSLLLLVTNTLSVMLQRN